ncbi:MAG: redox-sensing transcriptional repressor Rex [Clostridiales bacterium]|nr:redox-sensing transcriptional repressor Rex [Clostridiales bacterium]
MSDVRPIPMQTFRRLPGYHRYLKELAGQGVETIAAVAIAKEMKLHEVQVRKDLAAVSVSGGRPRMGFRVEELLRSIEHTLGYDNVSEALLVGVGQLGRALMTYEGFEQLGLRILAGFDCDPAVAGTEVGGKPVLPMEKFCDFCRRTQVHLGILAVPGETAQQVCDLMVGCGILAIWNFAPVHLTVPAHILVEDENMALSLALLSQNLKRQMEQGDLF